LICEPHPKEIVVPNEVLLQARSLKISYILLIKTLNPLFAGLLVFVTVTILTQYLAYQRYLIGSELEHRRLVQETNAVKDRLITSLSYSLSATKTLAFIVEEYGVPNDFNRIAKEILESNKFIDALELTREGVITHVYPMEGNERAIGFNVFTDSITYKEAYKAIEKKVLFFAGPFELTQGGLAVVGRLPIFNNNNFWGFSVVLIKLSTLLKAASIDTLQSSDFAYQLSKVNPSTFKEDFFLKTSNAFNIKRSVSIEVPDGEWKLYVMLKNNQTFFYNAIAFSFLGIVLSCTLGYIAWSLANQPAILSRLVKEKTLQLASSEKYFRSLIEKSCDAIVLLDANGKVIYQSPSTENISGYSLKEMQSIQGIDLIHPEDREEDYSMFLQLVKSPGITLSRSHRFKHKDGHYMWLEGTYTNLLDDENVKAIVYNYQDVSLRVETEQKFLTASRLAESIINSLPGVFYFYDRSGKFIRWNKNFETVSGYSGEEISRMHPLDFFKGEERRKVEERINDVFSIGHAEVQALFCTKNQERIPYYFNGRSANFNGVDYLIGMGIDVTDRTKVENEMRERTEEIQKLTTHLQNIREEERTRIAREIHDELGQQLTGLKMDASWIDKRISKDTDQLIHEKLSSMLSLIDETVKTVRRISSELRPGILDDLGLIPALEWQCQEFEKRTGIESKFYTEIVDLNPEGNLSTNIFRVYQEALTNVARHAHATLVETSLTRKDGYFILTVKDNGTGFDMEEAKIKNSLGLVGMRERALLFHGDLTIESEKRRGSIIILRVPFHADQNV
jgi:PAS domain S-box-containing protein